MVAAMDKVGVDGAIYISPFSMYQYDASYAVDVRRAHPDRFALVKVVNPDDPAVAEVIAEWKRTPLGDRFCARAVIRQGCWYKRDDQDITSELGSPNNAWGRA
jgi:hypothetical protein